VKKLVREKKKAKRKGGRVARFSISMEEELLEAFDSLIARKGYSNRSEAVRDLIRNRLVVDEWEHAKGDVVAAVAVVYDHNKQIVVGRLMELQHQFQKHIVCTTHVHLDENNCLEVVILRGKPRSVREVADKLVSLRGVKHGAIMATTTGKELV
jgi:CopG family nickel-responsive transcriptional regulator